MISFGAGVFPISSKTGDTGLPVFDTPEEWLATLPTVGSNALVNGVLYVCRNDAVEGVYIITASPTIEEFETLETKVEAFKDGGSSQAIVRYGRYDSEGYREFVLSDDSAFWVRRLTDGKEAYRSSNTAYSTKNSFWDARKKLTYEDKNEEKR